MTELDPQVVALAKAIREHETGNRPIQGGSGELASRYQFLPDTWKAGAQKYLGDANAPLTLENENKVAYSQIKEWKDKGYNPGQIAAAWNAGEGSLTGDRWKTMQGTNSYGVKYDVPKYVNSVYANYEKFKPQQIQQPAEKQKENKGILSSILSTPAGVATSAYNLVKSAPILARGVAQQLTGDIAGANMSGRVAEAEMNRERNIPILGKTAPLYNTQDTTGQMIKKTIGAGAELASYGIGGQAAANIVKGGLRGAAAKIGAGALEGAFGGAIGAGGQAAAQDKTAGEIGQATLSGAAFGGAIGGVGAGIPVVASALGKYVPQSVKFALGKASGLDKSTLETGLKYTDELAAARKSGLTRETIGKKVEGAVDNIIKDVSETGRAYESIRNSGAVVEIPTNYWRDKLDALGVKIKNGVVDRKSSKVMTSADSKAINEFLQIYAKEGQVSADDFLRTREALANVAKYDAAKSTVSSNISKSLREGVNADFRQAIPGLEDLDAQYAPLKEMLREIRGKVVDKNGEVKLSSVVNALKAGRTNQLKTLEKLSPGITKELEILSAIEDIAVAGEKNKIGAYAQSILFGGGFLAGGLPGAVVGLLASNPNLVMDVIQYYAKSSAFLRKNLSTALPKIANGIKPNAVEAKAIQNAIEQEIKNPVVLAGLLPEKAGPDAGKVMFAPSAGILEGQAKLRNTPNPVLPKSGIVKNAQKVVEDQQRLAKVPTKYLSSDESALRRASQKAAGIFRTPEQIFTKKAPIRPAAKIKVKKK